MTEDQSFQALRIYVDCAATLAESIRKDIRRDGQISPNTLASLNAFILAANEVEYLIEPINKDKRRLN